MSSQIPGISVREVDIKKCVLIDRYAKKLD